MDIDAHIDLITDLKGLKLDIEAESDNIGDQLNRPDIVRDSEISSKQGSHISKTACKFEDLVEAVARRATVLRSAGKEPKAPQESEVAKVSSTSTSI